MGRKRNYSTGSSYESEVAYSRAVRIGDFIEVAGTTAIDNGKVQFSNDAYRQAIFIFQKIEEALKAVDGKMSDVVRTRMFVRNIEDWKAVGKAHGEVFKDILPVTSLMAVTGFVSDDMLVEIEATAILSAEG